MVATSKKANDLLVVLVALPGYPWLSLALGLGMLRRAVIVPFLFLLLFPLDPNLEWPSWRTAILYFLEST